MPTPQKLPLRWCDLAGEHDADDLGKETARIVRLRCHRPALLARCNQGIKIAVGQAFLQASACRSEAGKGMAVAVVVRLDRQGPEDVPGRIAVPDRRLRIGRMRAASPSGAGSCRGVARASSTVASSGDT